MVEKYRADQLTNATWLSYSIDWIYLTMKKYRIAFTPMSIILVISSVAACVSITQPTSPPLNGTVQALLTRVSAQSTQLANQQEIITHLATRVPLMPPTQDIQQQSTPVVEGSLLIEDDKCCIGGIAGQPVPIHVTFQASSPFAEVSEMRVRTGLTHFDENDFSDVEWEPFSSEKDFGYIAPLNWTGFYVSVQFKDALENLSPVCSADISVEGMPAPTIASTP